MKLFVIALAVGVAGCATVHAGDAGPVDACAAPGRGPASAIAASDAPRRRIYLVRHGEANYLDADGQRLADPDSAGLSGRGIEQARAAAQWFCTMGVTRFDRVLTSDLPRAAQTSRTLLDAMGLQSVQPQGTAALRELDVGNGGRPDETVTAARARILPALDKLRAEPWDTALVVAHSLVDQVILSEALAGSGALYGRFEQGNGCINILDIGPGRNEWVARAINVCPDPSLYWTRQSLGDRLKR